MRTSYQLIAVLCLFLFGSCSIDTNPEKHNEGADNVLLSAPEAFVRGLKAHGGHERWEKFYTLQFNVASGEIYEQHLIDLKTRKVLITADTAYSIGFEGEQVWVSPTLKSFPGGSPRFYHSLVFYFFSMPFVLADPGTVAVGLPDAELYGQSFSKVRVTFGKAVGDSPNDQYILWFKKDDNQLYMLNYSATYFDPANKGLNAVVYNEWREANGILVPTKWSYYEWKNGSLGDLRGTETIENVVFSEKVTPPEKFTRPLVSEISN